MADVKVSGLSEPTGGPVSADKLYIVDVSDTADGADGSSRTTTLGEAVSAASGITSVTAYGATGDGSTDDTTAIQDAIDAVAAAGGGTVFLPAGTYIVTGLTIPVDAPVILRGAGPDSTFIKLANSADANVIETASIDTWTGTDDMPLPSAGGAVYGFQIRDLTIDGNRDNNYSGGVADETEGVGLRIYGKSYIVDGVKIIQCAGIGLWSEYDAPSTAYSEPLDANFGGIFNTTIIETNYEGLVFKGPADIKIDNVLVGKCHDPAATTSAALGSSLAFAGQSIDGVVIANDTGTVEIGFLHTYGCREGYAFRASGASGTMRLRADNLTAEGGIGCARFDGAIYGNVRMNTRNNEFGSTGRPDVTVAVDSNNGLVFEYIEVRRSSGNQAVDCVNVASGNADFEFVRIHGGGQPGHGMVFESGVARVNVGSIRADLLRGTHDDTNDSRALWTKSGCDQIVIGQVIADRCDVGWRNDSTGRVRVGSGVLRVREGALSNVAALDMNASLDARWPTAESTLLIDEDAGLSSWPRNSVSFANDTSGSPTLKVAPQDVQSLTDIADAGDDTATVELTDGDGIYLFTILVTAIDESSNEYLILRTIRGRLDSGTLTLETAVDIDADDSSDVAVTYADNSGDLDVKVDNDTGGTEAINATVATGWMFVPVPTAPTP